MMPTFEGFCFCPICSSENKSAGGIIVLENVFGSTEDMVEHVRTIHCGAKKDDPRTMWKCFCGGCVTSSWARHIHDALGLPKQVTVIMPWHLHQHYTDYVMGARQ